MKKTIKIIPRGKQVLVEPDPEESRVSDTGIVTPHTTEQEQKAIGTVIEVGLDIKDIKKGDKVIYAKFGGEQISLHESTKDVDYILLYDEDILAFIE